MKKYMTQNNLKQNNISEILGYIVENGAVTRREIERNTGFSWGTVSEIAAQLLDSGYVEEEKAVSKSGAGRTGYVLKPCGDRIAVVGIDINRSGLSGKVVGFDGSVKYELEMPFECTTQRQVLDASIGLCRKMLDFCEDKLRVVGIGVAFQGAVDSENGVSVRFPLDCDWIACSIKQIFEDKFGVCTYLEHDPKCMLISKSGNGTDKEKDLVLVRIDEGIGMAVMQDRRILKDTDRLEIGHTLAVYHGLSCSCGRDGCLEAYSSIDGIMRRCGENFDTVIENKKRYGEILDDAVYYLAVALHNTTMMFAPKKIILTGKFASYIRNDGELLETLKSTFYDIGGKNGNCIEISVDDNISAAYGAALNAINKVIKNNKI